MTFRRPLWLIKLTHYEYWTWYLFFLPLAPYWLYQALDQARYAYQNQRLSTNAPRAGLLGTHRDISPDGSP